MNWKSNAIAAAALGVAVAAFAQQPPPPPVMGPGMMDHRMAGHGEPGHGHGDGMGSGMMLHHRERGTGPAMMGSDGQGCGMWPGMMEGRHGTGMMGGFGEMGAFGMGAMRHLDLSADQRQQVLKVQDELHRKNWDLKGKMYDEMAKLRDASWAGEKRDKAAILAATRKMSELRQQMLENALDAADKADAILTPPQREQLRRFRS